MLSRKRIPQPSLNRGCLHLTRAPEKWHPLMVMVMVMIMVMMMSALLSSLKPNLMVMVIIVVMMMSALLSSLKPNPWPPKSV